MTIYLLLLLVKVLAQGDLRKDLLLGVGHLRTAQESSSAVYQRLRLTMILKKY